MRKPANAGCEARYVRPTGPHAHQREERSPLGIPRMWDIRGGEGGYRGRYGKGRSTHLPALRVPLAGHPALDGAGRCRRVPVSALVDWTGHDL